MSIRDMVARNSDFDETKDFIPTTPYATRVLFELVKPEWKKGAPLASIWDPAAGHRHMNNVFEEYGFFANFASDVTPFRGVEQGNFLESAMKADYIVTNPPYKYAHEFVLHALNLATVGVAMLVRVQFLEGAKRYNELFKRFQPDTIAFFSDRIPFKSGKVVRKASKMYFHIWVVWDIKKIRNLENVDTNVLWIPPDIQSSLEKDSDYE